MLRLLIQLRDHGFRDVYACVYRDLAVEDVRDTWRLPAVMITRKKVRRLRLSAAG
jgi:hypothetical protein